MHGILSKLVGIFTHVPNMNVDFDVTSKRLTTRRRKVRFADDVSDDEIVDTCRLHLVREVRFHALSECVLHISHQGLVGDTQIAEVDDWVYVDNRRTDTVEVPALTIIEEEVLTDAVRL